MPSIPVVLGPAPALPRPDRERRLGEEAEASPRTPGWTAWQEQGKPSLCHQLFILCDAPPE
eukprot:11959855-Alexandrium_andersonii.AAC.1